MIASLFILIASTVLFVYWFRYACLLILRAAPARDLSLQVAAANQLSFPDVQRRLSCAGDMASYDRLRDLLERDYRFLSYVLNNTTNVAEQSGVENKLLMLDFALMRVWYATARRFRPAAISSALNEMSCILGHFAHTVGETSCEGAAA